MPPPVLNSQAMRQGAACCSKGRTAESLRFQITKRSTNAITSSSGLFPISKRTVLPPFLVVALFLSHLPELLGRGVAVAEGWGVDWIAGG